MRDISEYVPPGEVLVVTNCWSCTTPLYKSVRRVRRGAHLSWRCDACDVTWSESGAEAIRHE